MIRTALEITPDTKRSTEGDPGRRLREIQGKLVKHRALKSRGRTGKPGRGPGGVPGVDTRSFSGCPEGCRTRAAPRKPLRRSRWATGTAELMKIPNFSPPKKKKINPGSGQPGTDLRPAQGSFCRPPRSGGHGGERALPPAAPQSPAPPQGAGLINLAA